MIASPTVFHATIADVTDEHHQNMAGLVQPDDFNPEVVVRFLRDNGIDACVDELAGGFRYTAADPERASHVRFACVCLRASISYALEAAFWCIKGGAMIAQHSPSPHRKRWNGQRRFPPVEPLSTRAFRLRIALGYSVDELAEDSGVFVGTIKRLESGKPVDKRELPALAATLRVPLCELLCGAHSCAERACVPAPALPVPEPPPC